MSDAATHASATAARASATAIPTSDAALRASTTPHPTGDTAARTTTSAAPTSDTAARMFDLHDRVAIVTGASSGLGAEVARALSDLGARVAVVARRHDRLTDLAKQIDGTAITCDLSDLEGIGQLVPAVADALGPPEILINAAGNRFGTERAEDEPLTDVRRTMELNLIAPLLLAQQVFPYMRAAGRGSIVNVSSISGRVGVPGIPQASYAASKAGLSGLTAELAVQWARHSIRVNTVAPGFFRSEITDSLYDSERGAEYLRRNTPLPRQAVAGDIAGAIVWLAGDAAAYVTGQTIVVDGGWTAR
ncbi:SDR family NAD(P)-dependent oxidoreductase [Nocardia macrotermitis]|nr:SDR family oxidoreductase [Nocardia macrotermitis]